MSTRLPRSGRQPTSPRGQARADALKNAASDVFVEKGYEAATMTEVAARAGASIGSLYQYYPTKADIAAEMHGVCLDALDTALAALNGPPAPAAVLADRLFETLAAILARFPAFPVLAGRRDIDPARKRASRAALEQALAGILQRAEPPLPDAAMPGLSVLLLEQIKLVVALSGSDQPADRAAIPHLRAMVRGYLAQQAGT